MTYRSIQRGDAYTQLVKMLSATVNTSELIKINSLLKQIDITELNLPYDKEGNTIFSLVAKKHGVETLKIMLALKDKGLNIYQTNTQKENALMLASLSGQLDNVKLLTKLNYPLEDRDLEGETVFLKACRGNSLEVVKYFIEQTQCDIYATDNTGKNAIHYCSYWNYVDMLDHLLKNTSIDIKAQTLYGDSSLTLAIYWLDRNSISLILEKKYFQSGQDFDDFLP